jgi:multiple stress resistance protein BhsA
MSKISRIIIASALTLSAFSQMSYAATEINHAEGKEQIGVVSADNALTVDDLTDKLAQQAQEQGATSFKIIAVTGNNYYHGVADIYK